MTDKPDHEVAQRTCVLVAKSAAALLSPKAIENLARCYLERCEELAAALQRIAMLEAEATRLQTYGAIEP